MFDDREISRGFWPAQSPDLILCDFYLWDTMKSKVFANNPHSFEVLKQNIRQRNWIHFWEQTAASCWTCLQEICRLPDRRRTSFRTRIVNWYVHHYAILTAKTRNESSTCGSVVTYESGTVSVVRSLTLGGLPGITKINKFRNSSQKVHNVIKNIVKYSVKF